MRALSCLLVLLLIAAIPASATAAPKTPKAKVALGAKKKKKSKKAKVSRAPVSCANTDIEPDAGNLEAFRDAIVCLHNLTRGQHGLRTLAENRKLAAAAGGHAGDMVARSYFDHITPEGGTFDERIIAAGYAGADDAWLLGENLAWGTGTRSTPAGLMAAWMDSPGHRANVLKRGYRELGIGVTLGTPTGPGGVTVAAEFGAR